MEDIIKHAKEISKESSKLKEDGLEEERLDKILGHTKKIKDKLGSSEALENISGKTKKFYLEELGVSKENVKDFIKSKSKRGKIEKAYSVYKTNGYAKMSNLFVENLSFYLIDKFPSFFKFLQDSVQKANIRILFKTYVSILLFTTLISLPIAIIASFLFSFSIIQSVLLIVFFPILVFFVIYFYPKSVLNGRQNRMEVELVFATVHMSSIAGSGTTPQKIFELLIESKDYKELDPDFKRIINNMNLFGYNLTTSLKLVASTTTSKNLKEVLNGIASTIETGGDLTEYLHDKSEDMLSEFRMNQQKYITSLSTYADIYTAVLIAAPLLLLITMVIIERISPTIGNLPVYLLANIGTYVGLPLLNIAFIIFLNLSKPGI